MNNEDGWRRVKEEVNLSLAIYRRRRTTLMGTNSPMCGIYDLLGNNESGELNDDETIWWNKFKLLEDDLIGIIRDRINKVIRQQNIINGRNE